jgi:L-fuconolactonase
MLDRREFLQQTAMVSAAGISAMGLAAEKNSAQAAPKPSAATPSGVIPIVDTHQHLWDLKKFRLPWIKAGAPLDKSFVTSDYLKATSGLHVVKTVYMEVDVDPAQQDAEIEYVTDLCRRDDNPMVAAVISGRPASDGFASYLAKHKDNACLRGLRQVLHGEGTPAGYCLEPKFIAGVRALGKQGWSFDLCMRPGELTDAAKLIEACPDTRFVLDHCGNAPVLSNDLSAWRRDIEAVAKRPNVIGKISGVIASVPVGKWSAENLAPVINHTLEVFGPDRVVFGGDWPVCTLSATFREWVEVLRQIVRTRPEDEQRRLFHDNAVRFYRLA